MQIKLQLVNLGADSSVNCGDKCQEYNKFVTESSL